MNWRMARLVLRVDNVSTGGQAAFIGNGTCINNPRFDALTALERRTLIPQVWVPNASAGVVLVASTISGTAGNVTIRPMVAYYTMAGALGFSHDTVGSTLIGSGSPAALPRSGVWSYTTNPPFGWTDISASVVAGTLWVANLQLTLNMPVRIGMGSIPDYAWWHDDA